MWKKNFLIIYFLFFYLELAKIVQNQKFKFKQKGFMIPHPDKAYRGGQDAFYAGQDLLVVADGVGGWNYQGVDPGLYSRFLCSAAQVYYQEDPQFYNQNLIQLIVKAAQKNKYVGSATMVVATIKNQTLKTCYIGDSGLIIIRPYVNKPLIIYQFTEQQHQFNFPYQLAMKKYGGDDPYHSICVDINIKQNDIIIMGSDGLFDNIFKDELLITIQDYLVQNPQSIFQLSQIFAKQAIKRGQNNSFNSPFSQRAKQLGIKYQGGKLDDTTVIIARIQNTKIKKQKKKQKQKEKQKQQQKQQQKQNSL